MKDRARNLSRASEALIDDLVMRENDTRSLTSKVEVAVASLDSILTLASEVGVARDSADTIAAIAREAGAALRMLRNLPGGHDA